MVELFPPQFVHAAAANSVDSARHSASRFSGIRTALPPSPAPSHFSSPIYTSLCFAAVVRESLLLIAAGRCECAPISLHGHREEGALSTSGDFFEKQCSVTRVRSRLNKTLNILTRGSTRGGKRRRRTRAVHANFARGYRETAREREREWRTLESDTYSRARARVPIDGSTESKKERRERKSTREQARAAHRRLAAH